MAESELRPLGGNRYYEDVYKRQHISLVYRGTKENAAKFITEQEHALQELYPPETEAAEAETGQPRCV